MRYRLAVLMLLMLLAMLPVMNVLSAPAPKPAYAILAIGPSPAPTPKWTDEEYRKSQKKAQTDSSFLSRVMKDPEVRKLPLIASKKDPYKWQGKLISSCLHYRRLLDFVKWASLRFSRASPGTEHHGAEL
jgi:hypothetical protein